MAVYPIAELQLGAGMVAFAPMPGSIAGIGEDLSELMRWRPSLVITLTQPAEMPDGVSDCLATILAQEAVEHLHWPLADFSAPPAQDDLWTSRLRDIGTWLAAGERVLVHCKGGCGRSGMLVLRLLLETGEDASAALARLRAVRPCAVETDQQMAWATKSKLVKA